MDGVFPGWSLGRYESMNSDQGWLKLGLRPLHGLQLGPKLEGLLYAAWVCVTQGRFPGRWCWWQDQGQTVLQPSPQRDRAVSVSVAGNTVYNSVPREWTFLLKTSFLSHGPHWGFTVSYLHPKPPTKSLFFCEQLNYCWIPEMISMEDLMFFHISDATQHTRF